MGPFVTFCFTMCTQRTQCRNCVCDVVTRYLYFMRTKYSMKLFLILENSPPRACVAVLLVVGQCVNRTSPISSVLSLSLSRCKDKQHKMNSIDSVMPGVRSKNKRKTQFRMKVLFTRKSYENVCSLR